MPRLQASLHPDFVGWTVADFMAGCLIELRKLNARSAGVGADVVDDPAAGPDQLLEVLQLAADIVGDFERAGGRRVGVADRLADLTAERAKRR